MQLGGSLIHSKQDDLHAPLVTEFSKQGYHILCEKPMATSISDCVKMVKEVESGEKKVFGIGHGQSDGNLLQGMLRKLKVICT